MEHGLIGPIVIIIGLIFIFGGARRLEDLGKGFGGFMREFNKARKEAEDGVTKTIDEPKVEKKEDSGETKPKA